MTRLLSLVLLSAVVTTSAQTPQTWSGVISDNQCGASHDAMAAKSAMSDRQCAFHCLNALAKYVVVDDKGSVLPVANQDFAGLPLRLGRPVRITGTLTDAGVVIARIEPPVVHSHIGHVMTAWKDTPGTVGLLTVAISDARVAAAHALLTSKSSTLDDIKLHAGHVLHALDPEIEPKGPASGYGAKKATTGAGQHLGFAAAGEGASPTLKSGAASVSAKLDTVQSAIAGAVSTVNTIRGATAVPEASKAAAELLALTSDITSGLDAAQQEMRAIMKREGL
jgi:hypothetical protein